ncbi:hypothetical protein J2T57_001355 [Natronocella acetinitrilica]|uniref:Uncharacterized protein n=1 Tax=Natronocella acetinitrilica TaxID=414046 RepID=A0AAE3KBX9_9GAMM|nr:hypothetical protein [Natronocella acetinitrilica]MCP1674253.1 hypothetical protein [Natronocella acetinitrilica]
MILTILFYALLFLLNNSVHKLATPLETWFAAYDLSDQLRAWGFGMADGVNDILIFVFFTHLFLNAINVRPVRALILLFSTRSFRERYREQERIDRGEG